MDVQIQQFQTVQFTCRMCVAASRTTEVDDVRYYVGTSELVHIYKYTYTSYCLR